MISANSARSSRPSSRLKKPARCCSSVARAGGARGPRLCEQPAVLVELVMRERAVGRRDEPSQLPVAGGAVGEDRELLGGVEGHQVARAGAARHERAPPGGGEDALDEVLA